MISSSTLYLVTRLDIIHTGLSLVLWLGIILFIILTYAVMESINDIDKTEREIEQEKELVSLYNEKRVKKLEVILNQNLDNYNIVKKVALIFFIFYLLCAFARVALPSTKEAIAIYIIPKIGNSLYSNKEIKEIPENILKYVNSYMENKIDNLITNKTGEKQ